jgi:hypothetical protein
LLVVERSLGGVEEIRSEDFSICVKFKTLDKNMVLMATHFFVNSLTMQQLAAFHALQQK